MVARTLAWLGKYHRLSQDYETLTECSECMIQIAMINLMIHRLCPGQLTSYTRSEFEQDGGGRCEGKETQ